MKHVAISIGHGPKIDRGAVSEDGKTTELDWNTGLATLIKQEIVTSSSMQVSIVHRTIEGVMPVKETNATNADFAIELHLNAFNTQASGTEMLYHPQSEKGLRLANLLQATAVRTLGLPDRGAKIPPRKGLAWLAGTKMPAVIVESFFIDNPRDLAIGNLKKIQLAKAYANVLMAFCP